MTDTPRPGRRLRRKLDAGKPMGRRPSNGPELMRIESEENECLRLHYSGDTYREIAEKLELSVTTAYRRVLRAKDNMRPHADHARYQAEQLAELSIARRPFRHVLATWEPEHGVQDAALACRELIRIQEREAAVVGFDKVDTPFDKLSGMSDEQLYAIVAGWAEDERAGRLV